LFTDVPSVYCENHAKHKFDMWQDAECFYVTSGGAYIYH